MENLSIKEKAERYDELLKKLQEAKVDNDVCDERYCCVIDDIVPELKESEDERIRKALIKGFNECLISSSHYPENAVKYWHGIVIDDILAWLENRLKSLRPRSQWKPSDEQIGALEHFVRSIAESGFASPYDSNTKLVYSLLNDLKKLKL